MKKGKSFLVITFSTTMILSCSKSDPSVNSEANCYVCSTETESIDVCEENGKFIVGGDILDNPNGASLENYIKAIESNPNNDPALEGISCSRK